MKRLILKFLTLIFIFQPALLLAKQGALEPARTIAQAHGLQLVRAKDLAVNGIQTGTQIQDKALKKIDTFLSTCCSHDQSSSKPPVKPVLNQSAKPVHTHQAPTASQGQAIPAIPQQVVPEQRVQRKTVYDKGLQSIKDMALMPFTLGLSVAQQNVALWGVGSTLSKVGFKHWPIGGTLPTFSTDSFKNYVIYSLPQTVAGLLVISAVDTLAYKAMKAMGLKRYTINSLIADSLHERGYEGFIKDQKDLKRVQRLNSKIERRLFKVVKTMFEEQNKQQLAALNKLNEQQILELIDKKLPEEQAETLFATAISQLNPTERKLLLSNRVSNLEIQKGELFAQKSLEEQRINIEKKVNYLVINALKVQLQQPVPDMFVHMLIEQMPLKEKQEMMPKIIKGLSEKEQKRFFKELMNPEELMEKEESIMHVAKLLSHVGTLKHWALSTLIGTPVTAWILKNCFGWVPGVAASVSSRIAQCASGIANANYAPTGSIFKPAGKMALAIAGTSPVSR